MPIDGGGYGESFTHTTYDQIIDDVTSELNLPDELAHLSPEQIQVWINEWQQRISHRVEVHAQFEMSFVANQEEYALKDVAPSEIRRVLAIIREDDTALPVKFVSMETLLEYKNRDRNLGASYDGDEAPRYCAIGFNATPTSIVVLYPAPQEAEDVTVHIVAAFDARLRNSEDLDTPIMLPPKFDRAIKSGVKADICSNWLRSQDLSSFWLAEHEREMLFVIRGIDLRPKQKVRYR